MRRRRWNMQNLEIGRARGCGGGLLGGLRGWPPGGSRMEDMAQRMAVWALWMLVDVCRRR